MSDLDITKNVAERVLESTAGFQVEALSNLLSKDTGVEGAVIWISAGEFAGADAQDGPRIMVVLGSKLTSDGLRGAVSVRLTTPPAFSGNLPSSVEEQVILFVEHNRDVLLRHWNGELGSKETLNLVERV